ncbi:hypothetical protein QJQ45_009880, partial [Haematococcus lacustris]
FTGASDPYAVLSVGPSMARSRVVFQSLNPAWHQRFFLYVKDLQADTLKVRLYDKDLFSSDDDLGTCLLPLSSLVPDQVTEMSLPLKGPGGQGSVYLRLRLARFSDHLLTRLTSHGASIPIDGGPGPAALQALEQGMAAMAALGQFRDQVVKKVDELRGAASANDVALSPWQVLADMAGWQSSSSWAPVAFIANEATDTQVWLYRNVLTREVVVGFRGTEQQVKWKDFLTDLHLVPASLDPERVDSAGAGGLPGPMRILQAVLPSDQVQVHQGFLSAYDSVRPQLFHLLDCITRSPPTPSSPAPPPTPPTPAAPGALDPSSSASTSSGEGREAVLRRISQMLSQWSGGDWGSSSLGGSQQQGGGGSQAETSSAGTSSSSSSSNRGEEDPGRPWRVYITGHSLGGALATLCAYELAARQSPERARQAITMYSFGAPRAGNKAFAARYNTLVPDSWRVTNSNDIIPSVPRLLGYAHVKHSVRIVNGELHIQADGTTDVFGEGRGGLDVLQELAGRAREQVTSKRWEDVYEEVKAREMAVFDSLVNGTALEEHMETFYLSALQKVVLSSTAAAVATATAAPAGSTGWVEIHVKGEAAFYRSGCNHTAIGQVTATMSEVITACDNLKPALIPLAHRTCAEAAAAALAKRLRGQEPAGQPQPMPSLCFTPTQAVAQPGPAHAPCPTHLPDQPPSHPSQSQLQGSSQHHPALPALLHLPGLTILTRPATNPVTSPAEEQQPIIHTTEEQDEQTMPPSMQQDWATARAIAAEVLQQIQQVPALLRLLRSQPDSRVMLQLSTLQDTEVQLGRLEFALQHIMQPRPFQLAALPGKQGPGTPAPLQQGAIHFEQQQQQQQEPCKRRKRGLAAGPRDKQFERMGQEVMEVFGRCGSAEQQAQLLEKVLTSPQLQLAVQQAMEQPSTTKPFVAMPMVDQKRDDKHWDDECLTLLCSFAPDSVMQLCTLGKKLSVKMLNEYCKAVGLYVPAGTLRADLRCMVLEHLNEQAECD